MTTAAEIGFERYGDFRPSQFDGHIPLEDHEHWCVAPVSRTRDSGCLDQSNFAQFLEGLGGESESVEVHRFGHWGPGWFEIIIFDPDDETVASHAYDMAGALQDYPVLDEMDLSQREHDDFCESWDFWGRSEFQKEMSRDAEDEGAPHVAEFLEDLDREQVDEIWQALADRLNWEYEHSDTECRINIGGAVALLSRENYAEIVRRYR